MHISTFDETPTKLNSKDTTSSLKLMGSNIVHRPLASIDATADYKTNPASYRPDAYSDMRFQRAQLKYPISLSSTKLQPNINQLGSNFKNNE